ncbi:hypothetical protein N9I95_02030, partial [Flavobacteriaceae bacterium]|nr:hypothetical protein [Flavobacteriaceae bacterium]
VETFTAYGDDSKEYLVCNSYMHEQNIYDLEIEINNVTTQTNDNKINTPVDNDEIINSEELYIYSAVGCSMDYVVDGYSTDKPNLDICVYRIELRIFCADVKEIKDGVYKLKDLIGDDHLGTLEELVEFQNNGEEIFDLTDVENKIYVYDGVEHNEPPTENEVEHVKWYSEEFFSSKDKALKYIEGELIEAKNNQTEYFSAQKYTDDSAKSILNENGENIIYDGLNFDKFNKVNGKTEGVYEKYYDGKLFSVCNYSDGLKNGVEKKLNSENIFVPFAHYIEGKQIISYSYYPSGGYLDSIKDIQNKCILKFNFMGNVPFKDKTINKLAEVRFDKTATKDIFKHIKGVKNIFLGPLGNIVDIGKFTDGKRQDLSESEQAEIIKQIKDFECFHPNGNLIDKRSFVNGKINGEWEIFDENGILRVKSYHKNGQRNGEQIEYYLNGQIHLKSNWINDVQQGLATTYYENGNKMKESNIVDGNYEGDQTEWWENGEVKAKRKYINDELKSEEIFSEIEEDLYYFEKVIHKSDEGLQYTELATWSCYCQKDSNDEWDYDTFEKDIYLEIKYFDVKNNEVSETEFDNFYDKSPNSTWEIQFISTKLNDVKEKMSLELNTFKKLQEKNIPIDNINNKAEAIKELKELKNLLDLDLITQPEFDKKSKELKKIILDN